MSDTHSDVDDELLALAGGVGGSSDDGGSRPSSRQRSRTRSRSRSRSRSQSRSRSRSRSQSPRPANDSPPRSVATKKAQVKKHRYSAGSEDEGEASEPGSPGSQGSAAMDESDSDDESDTVPAKAAAGDEENKYPVEGLFTSHAERKEIMNMREVEREQILAEREAEKERLRQKALLRRLVTNNEGKHNKRKGDDDELEESARKKARAGTKTGLDLLKRARAEKKERRSRRDSDRRRDRSPSYGSASSRDRHSDDSDDGWGAPTKKRSKTPPEVAPPADMHDIERCRLSRTRFARVAFYPGHDEALTGCYVRIHIGPDPDTKRGIYRMAVIKGFKTGRPYAIENDRGKTFVIDQYVIAAHGKAEREWPFIACSESNFTESEWNRYQVVCKNENVQIPKKPELAKRAAAINGLINHSWTAEEIAEKIKRQNSLMDKFNGVERGRLETELAQARAHGNDELASELQDKLDNTPQPRLAFSTSLKKTAPVKPAAPSQQDRLAEKNAVNRQLNAKNVREAQLAERRRVLEKERENAVARGEKVKARSRPGQNDAADEGSSLGNGTATPTATPKAKPKEVGVSPALAKLKEAQAKSIVPQIHKTLTDDDIIGALDLDIDIEID